MRYVVFDLETASACDLLKSGAWRYAQDFSTFITHIGFKVVTDNIPAKTRVLYGAAVNRLDPELLELARDPSVMFLAHNCSFECAMWKYHMEPLGYPAMPPERWHDSMASAAMRSLPLGLDALGSALELPVRKDMEGHRLMLQMCKPDKDGGWSHHTPEKMQREAEYNVLDVDTQHQAYLATGGLGASERAVWLADQRINQRGVLIDVPFVNACIDVLNQVRIPMTQRFRELTGLAPTQREKILNWVNDQGVILDDMRKGTLDALLDPDDDIDMGAWETISREPLPPKVYEVLNLRRSLASSSVAKLERMLRCAGPDGRVRYTMQYHGANTGRVAGRLIQIQNYPRGEIQERQGLTPEILADAIMSRNLDEIRELWGRDIFSAVISSLRSCIVPAKGKVLVAGDYAQVEARNVLSFAGHHDFVEAIGKGLNPYLETASKIFKRPISSKKEFPKEYHLGKSGFLGSGYGLGPVGFQAKFAPNEPIELAILAINAYRNDLAPLVPKFWYGLYQASVDAVWCSEARTYDFAGIEFRKEGDFLTMRLPSSRKIWFHKPQMERSFNPNTGNEYPAWSHLSYQGKKTRRNFMWYGQLMNNLVQGSARDLMVNAIHICEAQNLPVAFTVHDELVCEVDDRPGLAPMLKQIMEDIPAWARERRFVVTAETDVMLRYRK